MSAAALALDLARAEVKVHAEASPATTWRAFIPVFHRWIQESRLAGVLVDVAEYTHIAHGPQVLLVAHEGQWALDTTGGKPGLLYSQRRPPAGTADPLKRALKECLTAVALLEGEPEAKGVLAFPASRIEICVNDRMAAPNEPATYAALEPVVKALLEPLLGAVTLSRELDPRLRAGVTAVAAAGKTAATLLASL